MQVEAFSVKKDGCMAAGHMLGTVFNHTVSGELCAGCRSCSKSAENKAALGDLKALSGAVMNQYGIRRNGGLIVLQNCAFVIVGVLAYRSIGVGINGIRVKGRDQNTDGFPLCFYPL